MGAEFKKAFEHRVGKVNHETFIEVVEAFLGEVETNDKYIVPIDASDPNNPQIRFIEMGGEEVAVPVVSDTKYLNGFPDTTYTLMEARELLRFFDRNKFIAGIIINPFSPFHCFLPRYDTLECLKQNNIDIWA